MERKYQEFSAKCHVLLDSSQHRARQMGENAQRNRGYPWEQDHGRKGFTQVWQTTQIQDEIGMSKIMFSTRVSFVKRGAQMNCRSLQYAPEASLRATCLTPWSDDLGLLPRLRGLPGPTVWEVPIKGCSCVKKKTLWNKRKKADSSLTFREMSVYCCPNCR